jgi:hypothetical protein
VARTAACRSPSQSRDPRRRTGCWFRGACCADVGLTLVVMGRALRDAGQHRQDRRGAIQRLDLALLIDRQDHGPLGRVEVQANDILDLVDELRVGGELPFLLAIGAPARTPARSKAVKAGASRTGFRGSCLLLLLVRGGISRGVGGSCGRALKRDAGAEARTAGRVVAATTTGYGSSSASAEALFGPIPLSGRAMTALRSSARVWDNCGESPFSAPGISRVG